MATMWMKRAAVVGALTVAGLVLAAPEVYANDCGGNFCAYDNQNFQDEILQANAPVGAKVEVADDQTSSADNETGNLWIGKNRRRFLPDQTTFTWYPGTETADLGDAGNKIDHFDVR
jgi:hypothetical protein